MVIMLLNSKLRRIQNMVEGMNTEVDSMGEKVDSIVEFKVGFSIQHAAIEKAQADLRREYEVREERKRELAFLEKGGNPLDFNFGNPASVSVQSTSFTDRSPEPLVTCKAKGSFTFSASPHRDSIESSGRPEAPVVSEPCCADNLLLFNGKNDYFEYGKSYSSQNAKASVESAIFGLPESRAYTRRNRTRPNRGNARLISDKQQNQSLSMNSNSKTTVSNGIMALKDLPSDGVVDMILDNRQVVESITGPIEVGLSIFLSDNGENVASSQRKESDAEKLLLNIPQDSEKTDNQTGSVQDNSIFDNQSDEIRVTDGQSCRAGVSKKCLDSKSSDGLRNEGINETTREEIVTFPVSLRLESEKLERKNENKADDRNNVAKDKQSSVCKSGSGSQEEENHIISVERMDVDDISVSDIENKPGNLSTAEVDHAKENVCSDTDRYTISPETQLKLEVRTREDFILKEARVIEAKHKRIAHLSICAFTSANHQKSHWDFVLEEMAWLANDFAQERLWKLSAAAQLSQRVAFSYRETLAEKLSLWEQKKGAHTLSEAVIEFWLSAEEMSKGNAMQLSKRHSVRGLQEYAVKFLKYNKSLIPLCLPEAPVTPERISDLGTQELSWEEQFTEENLFYRVPPGAMETYRKAIEPHLAQVEKTGSSIQEEVETSIYDAAAGNTLVEDEGETNTYHSMRDMESENPSIFTQKKRILIKSSSVRSYDMEKWPANNIHNKSIPTKIRTVYKPRFTTPVAARTPSNIQIPNKTEASSRDTTSLQDDRCIFPCNMEVESSDDFGRKVPFDYPVEVSKPKMEKKQKYLGSSYEQSWQLENNFQNDLTGYSRKRFDKPAESYGSGRLFGHHIQKKQKMMRQSLHNSLDNYSSVASQVSNMSNSNKHIKILGCHRGVKSRSLKMPVGQRGTGSPWSSFEEQALIVLVHDLGPNWELISDAINDILQYKCIFRKPKDCSAHHKELISRTTGDGVDSAEDSGSSQPYPSRLPGIPKGSARALFQRLQEPIEEDMIKFHFGKIIVMSQKLHYIKIQNENQEQKPIQPHNSHARALSQVCPNGGPQLTPLDLCDAPVSSTDVLSGTYQGTHVAGLGIPNHGSATSLHLTSGASSSLQESQNVMEGNNFPSASTPANSSIRSRRTTHSPVSVVLY